MCGRFAIVSPPDALRRLYGYVEQPNFPPRFNIAPTQPVPVVTLANGARHFTLMRWGLMPGWVKDPKGFPLVINIRTETVREKPSFRSAFLRRRVLMPADGFYEWRRTDGRIEPFLIRATDGGPFAFAALHETWASPDGSELDTAAMLTTAATGALAAIHHRSPVILPPAAWEEWLAPETTPTRAEALLVAPPPEALRLVRIGPKVNSVRNDGPELWDEADATPEASRVKTAARKRRGSKGGDQGELF